MLNRVVLVGRLTKDPEFSMTPSGIEKATFTLAINRTFSNAQGEKEADFIYCVVWRKQAVNVNNYLKKGNLAGVDGRIQTRSYEGQDGKRIYVTEVVAESVQFLETKSPGQSNNNYGNSGQSQPNNFVKHEDDPFANIGGKIDITEDDLPF
jgi:single-strand DNA-binding protein